MRYYQTDFDLVFETIGYFIFFDYSPTVDEIYLFFPKKISKGKLKKILLRMEKKKIIKKNNFDAKNQPRYTVGEYGIKDIKYQKSKIKKRSRQKLRFLSGQARQKLKYLGEREIQFIDSYKKREETSSKKLNHWRFKLYIKLLSLFPQIKLIGLSGSMAMMNAKEDDDIDLFMITAKNRLWIARFISVFLAIIFGLKRRRGVKKAPNKVCLNLFFDETELVVPDFKKTEFVAHEILQMKPLIVKDNIYERFLKANRWVFRLFPNGEKASSKFKVQNSKLQLKVKNFKFLSPIFHFSFLIFNFIGDKVELILKSLQLYSINKHKTNEIVMDSQLWFHPDDFEKKIKIKLFLF